MFTLYLSITHSYPFAGDGRTEKAESLIWAIAGEICEIQWSQNEAIQILKYDWEKQRFSK